VAVKSEQGITNGTIKLDGDSKKFEEFVSLLDTFDPWHQGGVADGYKIGTIRAGVPAGAGFSVTTSI